ncbi:MAG: Acetyltransferase [Devosia sp.]|uniref:GNAT family N-acetyltransferase n=1 Tax=Devosia sp. TaxID=1871048 RepID=UPI002624231A|nr:GNAT family N-acetyltransferase [Devosia sp.]MDB5541459.1 Acetyltransferase [Devosia sp.]
MRLETERLVLREWREADKGLYAEIIGDPAVRRFFPSVGTFEDASAGIDRAIQRLAVLGFSFLALERKADSRFLGMLGMAPFSEAVRAAIPGAPEVEIGWQLGQQYWGKGYAPEAALAMLDFAFGTLGLTEVVAITYEGNAPSRRVMEKIGMVHDPEADFLHPDIPDGHQLRPHVLYRIASPAPREVPVSLVAPR